MVMCPGADSRVGWHLGSAKEVVAMRRGNRRLKLGTAGRWEVEDVPFWLPVISQ